MTAILPFPSPAAFTEALQDQARRDAILDAARDIINHAELHSDDIVHEACVTLKTYGTGYDELQADVAAYLLQLRQRRRAHAAAQAPEPHPWPRVVLGAVAFLAVAYVTVWAVMGGWA
jgi:hypothetical protein